MFYMMKVFAIVGLLLSSLVQNRVGGVPIQLYSNEDQLSINKFKTEEGKLSMLSTKENGLEVKKSFTIEQSTTKSNNKILEIMDPEVENTLSNNEHYYYRIRLTKRDTSKNNSYNDSSNAREIYESNKKENFPEVRASTIPFLPKGDGESQTTSSSGLPSLPGMSQIPVLSNIMPNSSSTSSNTPTAILGGFSILIMPMPGLTMANIGSALQTGQQMAQVIPGMPSLPLSG